MILKEKNIRTIVFYKIFFAACVKNKETGSYEVNMGNISEDFSEALEASIKTEQTSKFKTALDSKVLEKTKSDTYLNRNIELPGFSDTFIVLILNCMFHKHLLDQHEELINKQISVLNFLAKPECEQSKEEYEQYIIRNNTSEMEGIVGEAVEKRITKDKTVFTKDWSDNLHDFIITLANSILVLEFLTDPTTSAETPGILTMLHHIARKITKPDFKDFYHHNK